MSRSWSQLEEGDYIYYCNRINDANCKFGYDKKICHDYEDDCNSKIEAAPTTINPTEKAIFIGG